MKVHFLTENALEALRTNLTANLRHYAENTNDWIYEYFGSENPFMEYKQDFPEFTLSFNPDEKKKKIDVNNTIVLYSHMKSLTDTQATDERLWAGMCHCDFWSFLHERWGMSNKNMIDRNNTESRYFFSKQQNKKRSLITNSLSRLWWVGRMTYDENRKDPFELTKYLSMSGLITSAILPLFSNNYISNKEIFVGLITALQTLENEGYDTSNRKQMMVEATKYLNVLGGTYILDYFTSEEIEERVIKYMKSL